VRTWLVATRACSCPSGAIDSLFLFVSKARQQIPIAFIDRVRRHLLVPTFSNNRLHHSRPRHCRYNHAEDLWQEYCASGLHTAVHVEGVDEDGDVHDYEYDAILMEKNAALNAQNDEINERYDTEKACLQEEGEVHTALSVVFGGAAEHAGEESHLSLRITALHNDELAAMKADVAVRAQKEQVAARLIKSIEAELGKVSAFLDSCERDCSPTRQLHTRVLQTVMEQARFIEVPGIPYVALLSFCEQ
jgi:hypothetical protein